MKYLYTISLCLIFSFFININITNAENTPNQQLNPAPQLGLNCGRISCSPPNICISREGQPQCVRDEANSSGICQGDNNFRCNVGQACVKDSSGQLGCESIFSLSNNSNSTVSSTNQRPSSTPSTQRQSSLAPNTSNSTKPNTTTPSTAVSNTVTAGTNPQGLEEGLNAFKGEDSGLNTTGTLISFIANIIRWILGILGTVFFVIVVMQGYLYMTAGGDSGKTASAVGAIGNAVIGLLIIMGAFLITNFVTSALLAS